MMRCVDKRVLGSTKLLLATCLSPMFIGLHSEWKKKKRDFVCHVYNFDENIKF